MMRNLWRSTKQSVCWEQKQNYQLEITINEYSLHALNLRIENFVNETKTMV